LGFSGDLGNIGLNDVFHNVGTNRLSGTLHVYLDRRHLYVYLHEGKVSMAISGRQTPDGGGLSRGSATATTTGGKNGQKKRSRRSVKILLNGEGPDAEAFKASVLETMQEELYEAFAWSEGQFEFKEGEPPRNLFPVEQEEAGFRLDIEPILMEAARRTDEWGRIHRQVRSLEEIYVPLEGAELEEAPENTVAVDVLARMDGKTELSVIIDALPYGRFAVCKAAADLLRDRWIRPVELEERLKMAHAIEEAGDPDRAVRLLTGALEHERNDPELHESLAELFVRLGQKNDAAQEFGLAANAHQALEKDEEAQSSLLKAVELAPKDPGVRERLFTLLIERQDQDGAIEQGLKLAEIFIKMGLTAKAHGVYVRLNQLAPHNSDIVVRLARCERDLGNNKEAVKLLRQVASDALNENDALNAKNLLKEILKIQPSNRDVKRLLNEVESGEHAQRWERRKRRRKLVAWCIGTSVLIYALTYEVMARARLHAIQRENMTLIAEGRFIEAISAYQTLRDAYPLSLARIESGILIEVLARGQITDLEHQRVVKNAADALDKLEQILALAVAPDVYERARRQMTRLRAQLRVETYIQSLKQPDKRMNAMQALEKLKDRNALEILEKLLGHEDPEVRILVLRPLINMKAQRSIPAIIELLRDEDTRVRARAFDTLLILTGHTTPEMGYKYWLDWWRHEGRAKSERGELGKTAQK